MAIDCGVCASSDNAASLYSLFDVEICHIMVSSFLVTCLESLWQRCSTGQSKWVQLVHKAGLLGERVGTVHRLVLGLSSGVCIVIFSGIITSTAGLAFGPLVSWFVPC